MCPSGDGDRLDSQGATITVVARDCLARPMPGIPAEDFWLMGCNNPGLVLCGGSLSINADSPTDAEGRTTISGQLAAGGCDSTGIWVIVQGVVVSDFITGSSACFPIISVSPDINGDCLVDVIDLGLFSQSYTSPPHHYLNCLDYNCDGVIDLVDFSLFSQHYLHN